MARPESMDRLDGGCVPYIYHPVPPAHRKAKKPSSPRHPPTDEDLIRLHNTQRKLNKVEVTDFLIKGTKKMFPQLHEKTIIVPAVHFSRRTLSDHFIEGVHVNILLPNDRLSDTRFDESLRRFRVLLTSMCEKLTEVTHEVMTVCFSLSYDNYLNCGGTTSGTRRKRKNSDRSQDRQQGQPPHHIAESGQTPRLQNGDMSTMHQPPDRPQPVHKGRTPGQQNGDLRNGHSHRTRPQDASSSGEDLPSPSLADFDLSIFPRPRDLGRRGEFDMLIVHRKRGFILCEIKSMGDAFDLSVVGGLRTESEKRSVICRKLFKSLEQLDSNADMLRHLVSDLQTGDVIPVTKVLALPNLKMDVVRGVVRREPELVESFCRTFQTATLETALNKCIFAEHIPPTGYTVTPHDDVTSELIRNWWRNLTSSCGYSGMSDRLYETIVARFCGPATQQLVPTALRSRGQVSTLAQGVQETARCFTSPVLTQPQVDVLGLASSKVLLQGPAGSGKTLLLTLKARLWLNQGHRVIIISPWISSHALAHLIQHQIRQEVTSQQAERLHLVQDMKGDMEEIIQALLRLRSADDPPVLTSTTGDFSSLQPPEATSSLDSGFVDATMCCDDNEELFNGEQGEFHLDSSSTLPQPGERKAFSELNHCGHGGKTSGRGQDSGDPPAGHRLHVLVPEAPWFLDKLLLVLHTVLAGADSFVLWASSSSSSFAPIHTLSSSNTIHHTLSTFSPSPRTLSHTSPSLRDFTVIEMTHNLRRPPAVVREMMNSPAYSVFRRPQYTSQEAGVLASMPHPTDGPRVKRIQHLSHGEMDVVDCEQCGQHVARFLTLDLGMGPASAGRVDPEDIPVFRDVLVSGHLGNLSGLKTAREAATEIGSVLMEVEDFSSSDSVISTASSSSSSSLTPGFFRGLQRQGVRYDVMEQGDVSSYRKLAVPEDDDVVQVAAPELVKGLERKVVVLLLATRDLSASEPRYVDPAYDVMACCTSQLVIVGDAESDDRHLVERMRRFALSLSTGRAKDAEGIREASDDDLHIYNASDTDSLGSFSSDFSL